MTKKKPGVDYSTDKFLNGVESSNCTALLEELLNIIGMEINFKKSFCLGYFNVHTL